LGALVEVSFIMKALLYVPEELTPLFFTPSYTSLTNEQRVSYNRLHGMYFLEQTIFFEQFLGKQGLQWLAKHAPSAYLRREAEEFIMEEDQHSAWFRELLREIDPHVYAKSDFHLLAAGDLQQAMMSKLSANVSRLPALLWLQLMAEERALHFGRCYLRHADEVDPRFMAVQRKHLADEPGHIRRDLLFLEWLWSATPAWLRRVNAWLLEWLLREFFLLPKRSGQRVLDHWLERHPELSSQRAVILSDWKALSQNTRFISSLYPRSALPKTSELASAWPELTFMNTFLTDP
jgi:P-aminobenzoate N-oxygenase AurF